MIPMIVLKDAIAQIAVVECRKESSLNSVLFKRHLHCSLHSDTPRALGLGRTDCHAGSFGRDRVIVDQRGGERAACGLQRIAPTSDAAVKFEIGQDHGCDCDVPCCFLPSAESCKLTGPRARPPSPESRAQKARPKVAVGDGMKQGHQSKQVVADEHPVTECRGDGGCVIKQNKAIVSDRRLPS